MGYGDMKRSGFGPRKSSLKRSPFALASKATQMRRTAIKKKARKPKAGDDKTMRDACRDEPCYLRIHDVCNGDWRTCVPAHRNESKGAGLKNPDYFTLPACFACHYEFDQGKRFLRQQKRDMWNVAFERWEPARAAKLGIEIAEEEMA
jgi:hypothetical protein